MERYKKFYSIIKTSINFVYSEVETDIFCNSFDDIENAKEGLVHYALSEEEYNIGLPENFDEKYIREHLQDDGMKFSVETDPDGLDVFEIKSTTIREKYLKID